MEENKGFTNYINGLYKSGKDIAQTGTPAVWRFFGIKNQKAQGAANIIVGAAAITGASLGGAYIALYGAMTMSTPWMAAPFWTAGFYVALELTPIGCGILKKGLEQTGLAALPAKMLGPKPEALSKAKGFFSKKISPGFNNSKKRAGNLPSTPHPKPEL